jgi:hypothetical protein
VMGTCIGLLIDTAALVTVNKGHSSVSLPTGNGAVLVSLISWKQYSPLASLRNVTRKWVGPCAAGGWLSAGGLQLCQVGCVGAVCVCVCVCVCASACAYARHLHVCANMRIACRGHEQAQVLSGS